MDALDLQVPSKKERPILFSAPMVRAIIAGKKTQTRRIVKPQPGFPAWNPFPMPCKYGMTGDTLWVRETFAIESNRGIELEETYAPPFNDGRPIVRVNNPDGRYWQQCHYRATDPQPSLWYPNKDDPYCKWSPSIFMPRWASRITLQITDVRIECLQDISEEDAKAEGVERGHLKTITGELLLHGGNYVCGFTNLWNEIQGKDAWAENPWVWVIEFRRLP
jgi:hypothetical protein